MQLPLPASVVRDTLDRVFADPAFARGIRETLLTRAFRWLADLFDRIVSAGASSPLVRWTAIAILSLLVAAVVARLLWTIVLERRALARLATLGADGVRGEAPYAAALRAADGGEYTAAAHSLYHALVLGVMRRERVRLHPAKTAGDYTRELRARQSTTYLGFRAFARAYEYAVYGGERVDAAGWKQLHALAAPLLDVAPGATRHAA